MLETINSLPRVTFSTIVFAAACEAHPAWSDQSAALQSTTLSGQFSAYKPNFLMFSFTEESQPSWMDGVSRGWNYLEPKAKFLTGNSTKDCDRRLGCFTIYSDIKIPATDINDDIWWDPGNNAEYQDYNIGELTISNE